MTNSDKLLLINFITRTGMYINPINISNIHSFITGYEIGRKNKCIFYESSKKLLKKKYKIKYSNGGWLGQITELSEKQKVSNVIIFKKIALETLGESGFNVKMEKVFKSRVIDLITKINEAGHPWYNETWKDNWLSLVIIDKKWFRKMWKHKEWELIILIHKEVISNTIFGENNSPLPSETMLNFKKQFDQIN